MKNPVIAIVGRPNVGKSTLFNRVVGRRHAIVSPVQGTTRDRIYQECSWNERTFTLVDMGGIDVPTHIDDPEMQALLAGAQEQVDRAMAEADLIFFVVDARAEFTSVDLQIAGLLRRVQKPILLVANKTDAPEMASQATHLYQLGFGDPYFISASHGSGVGELLDTAMLMLKVHKERETKREPEAPIALAIVGKPNAGKSSILNSLLGESRVLVSPVPGTTRDATDTPFSYQGKNFLLIDTAGLRRRSKIDKNSIEHYSVMRAQNAIQRADIAVLVLDVTDDISHQDETIANMVVEYQKGLIIVVNKWDLAIKETDTMNKYMKYLFRVFDYLQWAPVIFTSAVDGQRIENILETAVEVYAERNKVVDQHSLTSLIQKIQLQHPPGYSHQSGSITLFGAEQKRTNPPAIEITTNAPHAIRYEYRRFLEKQFRAAFGFKGTFLQIGMRKKLKKK